MYYTTEESSSLLLTLLIFCAQFSCLKYFCNLKDLIYNCIFAKYAKGTETPIFTSLPITYYTE